MNVEEHTRKHTRVGYFILVGCLVLTILLWLTGVTEAGTWNDKPVMCGPKEETDEVILSKNEKLIFEGRMKARVYDESGIADEPAMIPFFFYANLATGTFTVFEYHPSYKTFCMLAHGEDIQAFTETL